MMEVSMQIHKLGVFIVKMQHVKEVDVSRLFGTTGAWFRSSCGAAGNE